MQLFIEQEQNYRGWGFSSVVERLPRKRKALGSVPSSEKKEPKKKKKKSKTISLAMGEKRQIYTLLLLSLLLLLS